VNNWSILALYDFTVTRVLSLADRQISRACFFSRKRVWFLWSNHCLANDELACVIANTSQHLACLPSDALSQPSLATTVDQLRSTRNMRH